MRHERFADLCSLQVYILLLLLFLKIICFPVYLSVERCHRSNLGLCLSVHPYSRQFCSKLHIRHLKFSTRCLHIFSIWNYKSGTKHVEGKVLQDDLTFQIDGNGKHASQKRTDKIS